MYLHIIKACSLQSTQNAEVEDGDLGICDGKKGISSALDTNKGMENGGIRKREIRIRNGENKKLGK